MPERGCAKGSFYIGDEIMDMSKVVRRGDDGALPPPPKFTCKSRAALGDVPANSCRTRASRAKCGADDAVKTVVARRRSGRLSASKDTIFAASKSVAQGDVQKSKQPANPSRGRSKSASSKGTTEPNAIDKQKEEVPEKHTRKRSRSVKATHPPAYLAVAGRNSNGANQKPAAKRVRSGSIDIGGRDGLPQEHHNLALAHFEANKYTIGISHYDRPNQGNVFQTPEYVSDIFQRLYHSEACNAPRRYIHHHKEVTASMRAILIDWLVEVHMKFRLVPETLHLAVNIIDRYLTTVEVPRKTLQLVGVTALLIAAKYEEIYPPEVKDCICITDRAFTKQDVLDMEADILKELKFRLTVPTGYPFLQRFLYIAKATKTMSCAANYYLERMLQEHDALQFRPSLIAASAVCLAINHPEIREYDEIETDKPGVHHDLVTYTGYTPALIFKAAEFVASKVSESVKTQKDRHLITVMRKYATSRYYNFSEDFESPDAVDIIGD